MAATFNGFVKWLGEYYSTEEQQQAEHLVDIYNRCIKEAADHTPDELKMENRATPLMRGKIAPERFRPAFWRDLMRASETQGSGTLRTVAEDMVSDICDYQLERSKRPPLFSGKPDDPESLCLEELKKWLVSLSTAECSEECLESVMCRRKYLERLSDNEMFKKSAIGTTMTAVLARLLQSINETIIPTIRAEIANGCVRRLLDNLVPKLRLSLKTMVEYVFLTLSDVPWPRNFKLADVQRPDAEFARMLNTAAGRMLYELVTSEAFAASHPLPAVPGRLEEKPCSTTELICQKRDTPVPVNYFVNTHGILCLPLGLAGSGANTPVHYLQQPDPGLPSGIEAHLLANVAVIEPYIRLHGLIQELARFASIWDNAKDLAGVGGDLLFYTMGVQHITTLVQQFNALIRETRATMSKIDTATDRRYVEATRSKSCNEWVTNYQKALHLRQTLDKNLTDCAEQANRIVSHAQATPMSERVAQAKEKTVRFWTASYDICNHLHDAFGLPHTPPPVPPEVAAAQQALGAPPAVSQLTSSPHGTLALPPPGGARIEAAAPRPVAEPAPAKPALRFALKAEPKGFLLSRPHLEIVLPVAATYFGHATFQEGTRLYAAECVDKDSTQVWRQENGSFLCGTRVRDGQAIYDLHVLVSAKYAVAGGSCTCPAGRSGKCQHCAALVMQLCALDSAPAVSPAASPQAPLQLTAPPLSQPPPQQRSPAVVEVSQSSPTTPQPHPPAEPQVNAGQVIPTVVLPPRPQGNRGAAFRSQTHAPRRSRSPRARRPEMEASHDTVIVEAPDTFLIRDRPEPGPVVVSPRSRRRQPDLEGPLWKYGAHGRFSDKTRHFELRGTSLDYFTQKGDSPKGTIDLRQATVQIQGNKFSISGPFTRRRFRLLAKTKDEADRWITAINAAIQAHAATAAMAAS